MLPLGTQVTAPEMVAPRSDAAINRASRAYSARTWSEEGSAAVPAHVATQETALDQAVDGSVSN